MRASLPMYNLPEMQPCNAAFWAALRHEYAGPAPEALDFARKPVPPLIEPDTLFTQVCGWPLQTIYGGQAVILGVPAYDVPYCDGPHHAGVFIVQAGSRFRALADLRGAGFVINSVNSNSGMNLPRRALAGLAGGRPFFGSVTETHSQPGNLERIAAGEADATCVDCVTFAFFVRHRPATAARLRVLAATDPTPAIPFVTSSATPEATVVALAAALGRVARSPRWAEVRAGLMLRDIVPPDQVDYGVQLAATAEAAALGYPVLC